MKLYIVSDALGAEWDIYADVVEFGTSYSGSNGIANFYTLNRLGGRHRVAAFLNPVAIVLEDDNDIHEVDE